MRLGVFTAMRIQVAAFWVVTPCNDVVGYRRFGRSCCFTPGFILTHRVFDPLLYSLLYICAHIKTCSLLPEDGGSMILRNADILSHHCRLSQSEFSEHDLILMCITFHYTSLLTVVQYVPMT
jgi:hypothetical protein